MIEQDLRTYLLAQGAIASLIGTRLYPGRLPQGVTLPAVTYQMVFGDSLYTHEGGSDLGRRRIQLDCWGENYGQAVEVAEAIRAAISGYLGPMGGNPTVAGRVVNQLDLPEPEIAVWRRMIEIAVWQQEAA